MGKSYDMELRYIKGFVLFITVLYLYGCIGCKVNRCNSDTITLPVLENRGDENYWYFYPIEKDSFFAVNGINLYLIYDCMYKGTYENYDLFKKIIPQRIELISNLYTDSIHDFDFYKFKMNSSISNYFYKYGKEKFINRYCFSQGNKLFLKERLNIDDMFTVVYYMFQIGYSYCDNCFEGPIFIPLEQ